MRTDISDNLVHFTKGGSLPEAYQNFKLIIEQLRIFGSSRKIKGGTQCVCFSEAPVPALTNGLVNPQSYSDYSPFGFIFSKRYIYSIGGRPVIYQPDSDFHLLHESMKWRHVRFELGTPQPIDFTWEREWRLPATELRIDPAYTHLVLPNKAWLDFLMSEHTSIEMAKVQHYAQIMPIEFAQQVYFEPFKWNAWLLS